MRIERYGALPQEAVRIRKEVFVEEQGFQNEFDRIDGEAVHLVLFLGERAAATCRYYREEGKSGYVIGRVAVRREFRGKGLGAELLREAERQICLDGGKEARLSAQLRARSFYERQGYAAEGEPYLDEYCPHVRMRKSLSSAT